jgi:hypothetical protein
MVGEESTELLAKPLTGIKTPDNTKHTHFSQYLWIDTVIFFFEAQSLFGRK